VLLMLKGYQILGFRLRTRQGEIDLLARRGRTLAVVEVKLRPTLQEAMTAMGPEQQERLLRAADSLLDRRPALRQLALRLDLIALAPGRFPRHLSDVLAERRSAGEPRSLVGGLGDDPRRSGTHPDDGG
jgi:putative endonuclease